MQKELVYLGLGGNEGDVLHRLQQAANLLSIHHQVTDLRLSHFYRTAPFQMDSSLWFVNAVCSFYTTLTLPDVFKLTQSVETQLGKVPKPKNADRPIDIDVLFYGQHIHQSQELEIPHPDWKHRLFVLQPLHDLTKEITLQGHAGREHYVLHDLIQPLLHQSLQTISLLEKNPAL
jgi:2-amino-4-hydroxy-6-hydroxymethyldihydropteridine diphosphokinase